MGAVDVGDQLRASYPWTHRWRRAPWQPLGWGFLLGVVLVNCYKLDKQHSNSDTSAETHLNWRNMLVKALFSRYATLSASRKRGRTGHFLDMRNMQLSPSKHRPGLRGKRAACKVCTVNHARAKKKAKMDDAREPLGERDVNLPTAAFAALPKLLPRTPWGCLDCDVAICKREMCWNIFHHTNLSVV